MPEGKFREELIVIAATVALPAEIAGGDQFGDDALGGTFGDAHLGRDIPEPHARVLCDAQQDMRVIRQKSPFSHLNILVDTRFGKRAKFFMYCKARN